MGFIGQILFCLLGMGLNLILFHFDWAPVKSINAPTFVAQHHLAPKTEAQKSTKARKEGSFNFCMNCFLGTWAVWNRILPYVSL